MDKKYYGRYWEYQKEYHQQHKNNPEYKARRYRTARKYIKNHWDKVSQYHRQYRKRWYLENKDLDEYKERKKKNNRRYDEHHKVERYLKNKLWRLAHQDRWKKYVNTKEWEARQKIHRAIKRGKIQRLPCAICGKTPTEMHHLDYNKPFLVVSLCKSCHCKLHRL